MTDDVAELFKRSTREMRERGLTRFVDIGRASGDESDINEHHSSVTKLSHALQNPSIDPVECLMMAAAAGWFPTHQPPATLGGDASRKQYLMQHFGSRDYCVRLAGVDDLPALMVLERDCWPRPLRTLKATLKERLKRYPQGQLVLLVDDVVVGVIYSQCIENIDVLDGIGSADVDKLHNPASSVAQLLAVNILPEMQQRNFGDQLLEFMLIYRSLHKHVSSVVAITLCKNFDRNDELSLGDYIQSRNAHGVLADPILRFHELHGATIERVMPGYRPRDRKNLGCGVLVSYDIHNRSRRDLLVDPLPLGSEKNKRLRPADIEEAVQGAVKECLGDDRAEAFMSDRPLMEMGLDSADLLELNEKVTQRFQLPLSPAFFFQYNTADKVAGYLCEQLVQDAPFQEVPSKKPSRSKKALQGKKPENSVKNRDVAIVGMACRLPGGINSPDELWTCLKSGSSVIGDLPPGRWEWPDEIDLAEKYKGIDRGGFLDDVASFDAPFFRISPAEAETMDPQQRILMELCWQTIEHAGYAPDSLAGSRTGVFIGASGSDYARLMDQSGRLAEAHTGTGSSMAVLANRLSYFYDFRGPSLLLDTACSSSLVAVHEAVRSIGMGESEQALVGGINLILHPANSIAYYKAGMLSPDGVCKTFDEKANGYVRSEGAVVLLLKPLRAALSDRDRIYGVIKGSACNHGGRASGLTVPNPELQGQLLQGAWNSAEIDPRALGYLEAHGTGTSLGDPIEVQGIKQAFAEYAEQDADKTAMNCGLGSVKSNLGHLEAAAGIAGLLKTVLCLQHRQLPPSLHFHQLNRHIEFADPGLFVVDQMQAWMPPADGVLRLAGVSSFGSGGTNAHVVVEEYPQVTDEAPRNFDCPVLFVISAKNAKQLREYAARYADWLASERGRAVPLEALAYQLRTGRTAMEERLALVIDNREELIQKLKEFISDPRRGAEGGNVTSVQFGELTKGDAGRAFIQALFAEKDLTKIALFWMSGGDVDWSLLDDDAGGERPLRIAAPTYSFARHSYWPADRDVPLQSSITDVIGPEVHSAPSDDEAVPIFLASRWCVAIAANDIPNDVHPDLEGNVLVIGASERQWLQICSIYADAHLMDIDPAASIDVLANQLRSFGDLDQIVWVAPAQDTKASDSEALIAQQRFGLLYLFKLVKALIAGGYGDMNLGLTTVTWRTQAVFDAELLDPAHAGVHGFVGALAKEFPRWSVRALDLESDSDGPLREAMCLPSDPDGEVLARRNGQWFQRFLCPVVDLPQAPHVYRQNGVYVVIGGAGGVGEAWSRYVIEHYQAQIIWIGRRQLDASIQAKLKALAEPGPVPIYVSADASDAESLQAIYANIKQVWPTIHGVIHSAVGAFDQSVSAMDEQRFLDILSVKVDASIHIARVFKAEPLDFILYFSSIVALQKNGGLSGYAAGGAFEDAFALQLNAEHSFPVKVINWGHWDIGTGAAIADATKTRLQRGGIVPIQPDEAMMALKTFLGAQIPQLALLKTTRLDALPLIDTTRNLRIHEDTIPSCIANLPQSPEHLTAQVDTLKRLSLFNNAFMETRLLALFASVLQSLDLFEPGGPSGTERVDGLYQPWLEASRRLLSTANMEKPVTEDIAKAWQEWEDAKRQNLDQPDLNGAITLVEACLKGLPDVLSGRVRATDILFPGASMQRVEDIYCNNAVADYFNLILSEALVSAIESRLQSDPDARLRILEIGAGTGSTTAMVLPRLAPYRDNIEEYTYSDVSKAFLFHAEEHFVAPYSYLQPKLFDVEKSPADQGIAAESYDFVIATNVLHATRDIRRTLSNCKAVLRKNGLLLLNEINCKSVFAHLTFGLLEGWWLSEDKPLRIPGAPGLYPTAWQKVLRQEGFSSTFFLAPSSHVLGQQVIVAESDGVVWQDGIRQSIAKKPATASLPTGKIDQQADGVDNGALKAAANQHLKNVVAKTLRMQSNEIDAREPLETYGIDSILIVQITDALCEFFADVPRTLLFECQSVDALSDYFIANRNEELQRVVGLRPQTPTPTPVAARPATASHQREEPARAVQNRQALRPNGNAPETGHDAIAVVGMSCRFPQAGNIDEYWDVLKSGKNCVSEIPSERWSMDNFYHSDPDEAVRLGKSYSKWGGFLDNVTEFDPLFFNISPKDAIAIDPQERLFLQTAWEALEDACYTRERLSTDFNQQLGVFVGVTRTGFDLFGPQLWQQGETVYPHTSFSSVANRLSYFLNARGPSVPVDTMCSSSLTAIHQACQSLRNGECEVAIAGGVNVYLHPSSYVGLSASRMLSKDGLCKSFGRNGNGFVPGEGVAAVLLKPLSQAIADNDRIYATVAATHVNHGGKTNGYTVPNPLAQAELIRDTLSKAGLEARALSYIEAHGTGTELGDPIEVSALTKAFRETTEERGFCALGSAKSNIGHLEAAAGIAGFIKVILQMRHGQIAPSLHAEELNPSIDFSETPFVVQKALADWPRPILRKRGKLIEGRRIAGVSSFGAGGANAHVIVEEYQETAPSDADGLHEYIIVLSAKTESRLKAYAARMCDFVTQCITDDVALPLLDLAFSLQVGREQMDQRLALSVYALAEVPEKLKAYIDGSGEDSGVFVGHQKQHKDVIGAFDDDVAMQETVATWFRRSEFSRLMKLWSKGLNIDWEKLYQIGLPFERLPRRLSLPTYPFESTPYWLPLSASDAAPPPKPQEALPVAREKPAGLALLDPALSPTTFETQTNVTTLALSPLVEDLVAEVPLAEDAHIVTHNLGEGIIAARLVGQHTTSVRAGAALIACLQWLGASTQKTSVKVVLLNGLELLSSDANALSTVTGVVSAIAGCAVPVIAVMKGENGCDAMRVAAACDLMICSAEGSYDLSATGAPDAARRFYGARFGAARPLDARLHGDELRQNGFSMPVVPDAEIKEFSYNTARSIVRASSIALIELKTQLSRTDDKNAVFPEVDDGGLEAGFSLATQNATVATTRARRIEIGSDVVTLDAYDNGVAVVTLCDRSSKNTFSPEFVDGVITAFAHIDESKEYKVVVLTGYDTYFACGGTKEGLLAIQNGVARFTDEQSYAKPLACDIPVIAAIQGHAIGAGWAMGLFCDYAIYSEESIYQSPYMLYGFTPGAGSTLIFPERLGHDLSRHVLLSAQAFSGRELKHHGIKMPVVPRREVFNYALALASHLASSSRSVLVEQKRRRCRSIRERLPAVFAQELAMHDKTFVGNKDVIDNIGRYFNDVTEHHETENRSDIKSTIDNLSARQVLDTLSQSLANELYIDRAQIDADAAFIDLGMDSISAVTWVRKINKQFGLSLAATKVYTHPTLTRFADFVVAQLAHQQSIPSLEEASDVASPHAVVDEREANPRQVRAEPILLRSFPLESELEVSEPKPHTPVKAVRPAVPEQQTVPPAIAIIGMAGQFPKADNVKQFWRNLTEGRECISPIPSTRWSIDEFYDSDRNAPGKTVCRDMGVLEDIDVFDPLFFNISPSEAESMDPQQRLFLENSWRCIEDAGYNPEDLSESLCGVFVGCAVSDYNHLAEGEAHAAQELIGESVAILPARVAYFLNLRGPCLAIDTACSASLVALASACDSLVLGNSELALAGGVYVLTGPDLHVKMSSAGMLSPDGRCFSFDQRANGFVPGEGVGVLMLKRLDDAERDGDDVYGVIRGWGVNQDGRTNGITAPNQESQTRLEVDVYKKFNINPDHIQLVEAHGTATSLGDPIEVDALCEAFRAFTDRQHYCALGSVKSNIGHLATAAGISGVIKASLAVYHRQLPPTINYQTPNEHINLRGSPFYVNTACRPWETDEGQERLVAVSSFGFSGTNAHVVLGDIPSRPELSMPSTLPILMPLSAKGHPQLLQYAQAVRMYLVDEFDAQKNSLADIAYTFQVGRPAMTHRLAVVAHTIDELCERLDAFVSSGAKDAHCCWGEVENEVEQPSPLRIDEDTALSLAEISRRWVAGQAVDWNSYNEQRQARRRHGLPSYPFERKHYWNRQQETVDAPTEGPLAFTNEDPSFDLTAWRNIALSSEIDWQDRLRKSLSKKILVVHSVDGQREAFAHLLTQMERSAGLKTSTRIEYCHADEATAKLVDESLDFVLFFGGTDDGRSTNVTEMFRSLTETGENVKVVIFVPNDLAAAERMGGIVATKLNAEWPKFLVLSQFDGSDVATQTQTLFKEWLNFDDIADARTMFEVHYGDGHRLCRDSRSESRTEQICLINKEWQPVSPVVAKQPLDQRTQLILVNAATLRIADALRETQNFNGSVIVDLTDGPVNSGRNAVDVGDLTAVRKCTQELAQRYQDITHVIDLSDLYDAPRDFDGEKLGKTILYQTLVGLCDEISILHVTKGLQDFRSDRMSLAGAKFAGLVKMLGAEYSHVEARTLDIDQAAYDEPQELGGILAQEFEAELLETELCYRDGQRYAPALSATEIADMSSTTTAMFEISPDAVYVVSGGTNGVGLEIAKHLTRLGCRKLVLMGITQLPPKRMWTQAVAQDDLPPYVRDKLGELIELNNAVDSLEVYTGSLTDQFSLQGYFKKTRATLGPILGVIHSAGIYSDSENPGFATKPLERMQEVWEAKAEGLESLHAIFEADTLDFFVSFSSMTGLIPNLGRGASDYAAANAFVEYFTAYQHRQFNKRFYKTITWSDWNQTGAITRIAEEKAAKITETFSQLGLRTFSNKEGLALFELAMTRADMDRVAIGYLDRRQFEQVRSRILYAKPEAGTFEPVVDKTMLSQIEDWETIRRAGHKISIETITAVIGLDQIKQLDPHLIHRIHGVLFDQTVNDQALKQSSTNASEIISQTVIEVLKLKILDPVVPFQNYGLDSISAMVLATRLEKRLKRTIEPRWLIEFPTVETLSRHLADGEPEKQ